MELRPAQVRAAVPILEGRSDLIISAATASGKTEAAMLPIFSTLAAEPSVTPGIEVLYLSPLKALINDQLERLSSIAEHVDVQVHSWHGDVPRGRKMSLLRKPEGMLLTTPESLEALFVLRGTQVPRMFGTLRFIVIDELHSFIGTERGAQLQSLLNRLEACIDRRVVRIALSATLGDMHGAAEFLRPGEADSVLDIVADDDGQSLMLLLKGYVDHDPGNTGANGSPDVAADGAHERIANDLFDALRGSDNLVFANSRRRVEEYSDRLRTLAEARSMPNEFFAHHGSLSKEFRLYVEARLKDKTLPVSAVCTSTLEMGIDIGAVRSIAQIGAPPSVASLRQRLGRSGRRGDAAVLRIFIDEPEITPSTDPPDALRSELVQSIATVNLLLERWYEPPEPGETHMSTLVQQLLSTIAELGGVMPDEAFRRLCGAGPFAQVSASMFARLLRHLGSIDVLMQSPDRTLLLGAAGERIVNHFSFYAAFSTPEEWRLMSGSRVLGSLPILSPIRVGMLLIFAGSRWRIAAIDVEHRVIDLVQSPGGRPPRFLGAGAPVHDRVREEMRSVYQGTDQYSYLDATAVDLLAEARQNFVRFGLNERNLVESGANTYLFLWAGDRVQGTVLALLSAAGFEVSADGLALSIAHASPVELSAQILALLAGGAPDPLNLAAKVSNKMPEKFDRYLPADLLDVTFAARSLDIPSAMNALKLVS